MTSTEEALAALEAKKYAERQLAAVATCPPWRHAVFGAIMGAIVSAPAFPTVIRMGLIAIVFSAIAIVVQSDRQRLGVFVNGYRKGKTRLVALPMLAVVLGLYALSMWFGDGRADRVTPLLLGSFAFVVGVIGSIIWQRVFVSELGA